MRTNIIRAAIMTPFSKGRWGLPICIEDEPGCGKTAVIEQLADELGLPCETLSPGERGESAFGVVPVPSADGQRMTYPRPDWTDKLDGGGLIFVDELTTAPPLIQAALLGLVLARRIGSHTFGPRVRVVAAYNPPEQAAGGFDLAAPLANRAGHLRWGAPTVEEHTAYMLSGSTGNGGHIEAIYDATAEEARILREWPEAFARARGLETAFLARRPALKNVCPKAGDPAGSRAWPSDRTWEMATRALAGAAVNGLTPSETEEFVASFISVGVASEWFAWMTEADLPDTIALLDGKETFSHNRARLDRTAAVLNACVAFVTPHAADKRVDRATALWGILEKLAANKSDLDLIVPPVHAMMQAGLHAMKAATKTLASVQPVLKAANIRPGK